MFCRGWNNVQSGFQVPLPHKQSMLSAVQHPKEVQALNRVVQYPKPGAKWLGVHCSPKGACSICPLDLSQGVLVSHVSWGWGCGALFQESWFQHWSQNESSRGSILQWNLSIVENKRNQHFVPYSEVSLTPGLLVYFQ